MWELSGWNLAMDVRRVSVRNIVVETQMSFGFIETILPEHLNMFKVASRWIPRLLTSEQKQVRK